VGYGLLDQKRSKELERNQTLTICETTELYTKG